MSEEKRHHPVAALDPQAQRALLLLAEATRREQLALINQHAAANAFPLIIAIMSSVDTILKMNDRRLAAICSPPPPGQKLHVECKRGCAWCCHQNVQATIPEAILVALDISQPHDPRRQAVVQTADRLFGLDAVARTQTGIPCPFLIENACSVYAHRPLNCRDFLSPSAKLCQASLESILASSPPAGMYSHAAPQIMGRALQAAIQGICQDLRLQHDLVDLIQAVASILRDPSIIARWVNGEPAFRPIQPHT